MENVICTVRRGLPLCIGLYYSAKWKSACTLEKHQEVSVAEVQGVVLVR
jgi:hypothetical protein